MAVSFAIPDTAEDMQDFLTAKNRADDRKQLFAANADPKDLTAFMTSYAKLANKADPGINEQVNEQVDRALASFARDHFAELRTAAGKKATAADVRASRQTGAQYNANAIGTKVDGEFANITDFIQTIDHRADRTHGTRTHERLTKLKNAWSSDIPSQGGFLVPEEMRTELLSVALESAIVRPRARVIPMSTSRIGLPMLDSSSNASSVFGGIIAYWTEEAAALVESTPNFAKVVLDAKKLTAYSDVPNELGDDSAVSLEAFMNMAYPEAIAWYEDAAFMVGTGVGEPLGFMNAANGALVSQAAEGSQTADTVNLDNVAKMYSRMLPSSLNRAVWIISNEVLPQLITMDNGTGTGLIWQTSASGAPGPTLLGRPVIISEKAGKIGDVGDINFVDLGYYLIGDRMAMSAMSSPHYKFGNDVTSYRFIERVDGRPWIQSAITPKNGSTNTLSPFVQLAAR